MEEYQKYLTMQQERRREEGDKVGEYKKILQMLDPETTKLARTSFQQVYKFCRKKSGP